MRRDTWGVLAAGLLTLWAAAAQPTATEPPKDDPSLSALVILTDVKDSGMWLRGGGEMTFEKGNLLCNSPGNKSISNWGSKLVCKSGYIGVVGSGNDGFDAWTDPLPKRIKPVADPYAALKFTRPETVITNQKPMMRQNQPYVLNPGVYVGGLDLSPGSPVTLKPGVYWMENGDFNLGLGTKLLGHDVTIILGGDRPGKFGFTAFSKVELSCPAEGPTAGFVLVAQGDSEFSLSCQFNAYGTIYLPRSKFNLGVGEGLRAVFDWVIANKVDINVNPAGKVLFYAGLEHQGALPFP